MVANRDILCASKILPSDLLQHDKITAPKLSNQKNYNNDKKFFCNIGKR